MVLTQSQLNRERCILRCHSWFLFRKGLLLFPLSDCSWHYNVSWTKKMKHQHIASWIADGLGPPPPRAKFTAAVRLWDSCGGLDRWYDSDWSQSVSSSFFSNEGNRDFYFQDYKIEHFDVTVCLSDLWPYIHACWAPVL